MALIKNTIMCEGWIEKQLITNDIALNKWKTRYAVLLRPNSNSTELELSFYAKKYKTGSQTDDYITLRPWKCIASIEETSRQYTLKLQLYLGGFHSPASSVVYVAMHSREEVIAWLRCIQGVTKLNIGTHESLYYVTCEHGRSTDSIATAGKQCVLHLTVDCVTLALKAGNVVVAVWPLSFIRTYSVPSSDQFSITSGRRSPLGEGLYCFRTRENAGETLFSDMDRLTGFPLKKQQNLSKQSTKKKFSPQRKLTTKIGLSPHRIHSTKQISQQQPPKLPSPNLPPPNSSTPLKPPRKPPLPKNIKLNFQTHIPDCKTQSVSKEKFPKTGKSEKNAEKSSRDLDRELSYVSRSINLLKTSHLDEDIEVQHVLDDILNVVVSVSEKDGIYENDSVFLAYNLPQQLDLNKSKIIEDKLKECPQVKELSPPKPKSRAKRYSAKGNMEEYTNINKL